MLAEQRVGAKSSQPSGIAHPRLTGLETLTWIDWIVLAALLLFTTVYWVARVK